MDAAVRDPPTFGPRYPWPATDRAARTRFATAGISTARRAMHSRCASHRQSLPTQAVDHAHRVGLSAVSAGARMPTGAPPHRSALAPGSFLLAGAPLAPAPAAGGGDNSVPRLDATGATVTSAGYSSRSALPQPPAARIAGGFRPRSGGPEPAVRFEAGQTGRHQLLRPFFGGYVISPRFSPHNRQKACAHIANVM